VCGILRRDNTVNIAHLCHRITLYDGDLTNFPRVCEVIDETKPDLVFHLAAQASVSRSQEDPAGTLINNVLAELNILQAVIKARIDPMILIPGSYEEYGLVRPEELPVKETNPLRPTSPYGVSKVCQDFLGYQYFLSHGLRCIRVRPFNHLGPRQSEAFFVPSVAKQIAEAEAGISQPIIRVGNLEVKRDFTDVRDIVRGYYLALLRGEPGEVYNLGSGKMTSLRSIVDQMLAHSRAPLSIKQDPARLRPQDPPVSLCDYSKFREKTGWEPGIPLEQTLNNVLEYWRHRIEVSGEVRT